MYETLCMIQGGGYKTGNMCGYKTGIMCGYKTNHSKKNCAGMTAIRPITRKFGLWVYLKKKNFRFFFRVQNTISAKGHFCGFDFYKTNHSKLERE